MKNKCSVEECCCDAIKNGFCNKHNLRFKRHGDPLFTTRRPPGTATKEDKKKQKREEYLRHKERYRARTKIWQAENPERYRENKAEYFSREEVKEASRQRTKRWVAENKEKKIEYDEKWKEENRPKIRGYKAKRRAKERQATPPWLTKEHYAAILSVYEEAERLTAETGVQHQVDHIVPLSGKTVSGLHVPWNLRAITAEENQRRPRVWDHNTQI
jgi:hypothetical protein